MESKENRGIVQIFSSKIQRCLERVEPSLLCEIRLRLGGRAVVLTRTGRFWLCERGLTERRAEGVLCDKKDLEEVMLNVTNRSVYSVNENLKQGFVTYRGCRVGLCGEIVREGGRILTVKNLTSLDVRVPHDVPCAGKVLPYLLSEGRLLHTLVFAPPACGKTTLVRDIAKKLSYADMPSNIVLIDERSELGAFGLADCDILSNLPKAEGLHFAVRNLNPDAVVCDEIKSAEDVEAVFEAASCGVAVIATIHAGELAELERKAYLSRFFSERVFRRYVRLSDRLGLGTAEEILDEDFRRIAGAEVLCEDCHHSCNTGLLRAPRHGIRGVLQAPPRVL